MLMELMVLKLLVLLIESSSLIVESGSVAVTTPRSIVEWAMLGLVVGDDWCETGCPS